MRVYILRFLFVGIVTICIGLLFFGGKHFKASVLNSDAQKKELIWPADGVISDTFGTRQGKHKGIDIAGKLNSPIFAVDDGVVEKSYYSSSYGNVIFIHHQSNYVTVYAHLSTRLVAEGQSVKLGQIIGKMGSSGEATGVHLHFETHETEWTYDKKYAFDPEGLLGTKKFGEVVQAGSVSHEENALEASLRYRLQEEKKMNLQLKDRNRAGNQYVVQKNDTLSYIAGKMKITVGEIKRKNHLSSDLIKPGQVLIVR